MEALAGAGTGSLARGASAPRPGGRGLGRHGGCAGHRPALRAIGRAAPRRALGSAGPPPGIARLCEPSSELHIAEHWYRRTALEDLLGLPEAKVNDDRLYRALDRLLPHKDALEGHLKERLGSLFELEYDLLLYDVTSTYFEGQANRNPLAARGYSRDHRSDCKQVCIGLVVSREGFPLGYEVFAGNKRDSTTLQDVVKRMEERYGSAGRIWAVDRGMIDAANLKWLKERGSRYIVGTPKGELKRFEQELLKGPWHEIREGLEVRSVPDEAGS